MNDVQVSYRVEHGEGHYVVSNGVETIHCDSSELTDTIRELKEGAK